MYLKKVLNQPNLVGTMLIALMVCAGFVYAFAFDGFNVETVPGSEVETWLAQAGSGNYDSGFTCNESSCNKTWALCIAKYSQKNGGQNCTDCQKVQFCRNGCKRKHMQCHVNGGCPPLPADKQKGCSGYSSQKEKCPKKCKG